MAQDMEKAKQLIAEYKAENPGDLTISLATTQDQTNAVIAQQQQQWWKEAGFDDVTLDQVDQANYILTAALGNFQVFQWRNHGGFDLDQQYAWWHSSGAKPVGELTLNFGRIKDDQLDALLDAQLVPQYPWILEERLPPGKGVQVGSANADAPYAHQRFARRRQGRGSLGRGKLARALEHDLQHTSLDAARRTAALNTERRTARLAVRLSEILPH